jgi:glycosyltransferase involved in cell wall biosynthesis
MSLIAKLKSKVGKVDPRRDFESSGWEPHSRLMIIREGSNWSLDWDGKELTGICQRLKIPVVDSNFLSRSKDQSVFYTSRYHVLNNWETPHHRIAFPYFHGKPGSGEGFARMISTIKTHHDKIARVQVSHSEMHDIILETGIAPDKVFRIPIGINLDYFKWTTPDLKKEARLKLGIPQTAVVIGSFQKDGNGWGEGLEPKLIKGPDVFLRTVEILKEQVPELFILLTGPARGYVKKGLEELNISYSHQFLGNYTEIGLYYNALDLYIVSSREEGGPKAVLESMASGVPLVTTRVGQAMDLVKHLQNGWMVEPEDAEGLAHWSKYVIDNVSSISDVLKVGRQTAEKNSYQAQLSLWENFMKGFVLGS